MQNSQRLTLFFSSIVLILLSGCVSHPKLDSTPDGYIKNYEQMTAVKGTDGIIQDRWASPELNNAHNPLEPVSLLIKPVIYFPKFDSQSQFMKANANKITTYLTDQMQKTAAKYFPLTDTPTAGTFIIAPAITQVMISSEGIRPTEILPVGAVIGIGKHLLGTRDKDVEIRLENNVTLADDNRLLATSVFRGEGLQLENNREQLSIKHLKPLFNAWIAQWDRELASYKQIIDKRHDSIANTGAAASN
ncbi:hypothetical protein SOPP22_02045 [Shewanella sp. OPT22]|nr:hypothetical protein SOPP22_02045 [Shewanella sp. OPT22]